MHSEYTHTPSDTRSRFNVLMYAEIYRCGADPNRIRIGLFFRSPPLQFACIVISSACCHVPSPFLCAVELAAVVLFLTGWPGCLACIAAARSTAGKHASKQTCLPVLRFFSHEALDGSAKLHLREDRLYFLVTRLTTWPPISGKQPRTLPWQRTKIRIAIAIVRLLWPISNFFQTLMPLSCSHPTCYCGTFCAYTSITCWHQA